MAESVDLIVIGAGETGALVASKAVDAGKRVAMIYKAPYGSTCLNVGCVPSKWMIHRARIAHLAYTAARFHVHTSQPSVDLAGIVGEKNEMISKHRKHSLHHAENAEGLTLVEGEARFVSRNEVAVGDRTFRAETIVIATGMRPLIPPVEGLDGVPYLTNESPMERGFLGHAVFTDPAIGGVGLTEAEAREQGLDVAAGLVTFDKVEKAQFIGETTGLMKYVIDRQTHRLLGCHVIGPDAENLIYDAILVMRHDGTINEIAKAVGIFPTLQEGMEGTARGLLRKVAPEEVAGPLVTELAHH